MMNALKYVDISFAGAADQVSFVTKIDVDPKLGGDRGIGRVRFFYEAAERAIFKEEENISQIYKETPPRKILLIKDVDSFELSYFFLHLPDKTYSWENEWPPKKDVFPTAVRFTFQRNGEKIVLTFLVPAGGEDKI